MRLSFILEKFDGLNNLVLWVGGGLRFLGD